MRIIKTVFITLTLLFSSLCLAEMVNINTADAETIAANIKGIGPSRAAAIVSYREEHGPFETIEDLTLVKGVGEKTVVMNKDKLTVGDDQ